MRDQYDFSNGVKNPYAAQLKQQITINLDTELPISKSNLRRPEFHIRS